MSLSAAEPPVHAVTDAVSSELEWAGALGGVRTGLVVAGAPVSLAPETAGQLVRIVQEALANAVAHASAASIRLGLIFGFSSVVVVIDDDGSGFDARSLVRVEAPESSARGSAVSGKRGLGDIRSRAERVGGTAQVDSIPGWGTRVRVELPYRPPRFAAADGTDAGSVPSGAGLTPREQQVRALVERGWPDKRVAAELGISVKTAEKHVGMILRKTGAANRTVLASRRDRSWGKPPSRAVGDSLI